MSEHSLQSVGNLLQDLLRLWRQKYPRRATGGWWALAGFAFQTSTFLLRFFQRLKKGATEPGQLAEMEQFSDILYTHDGRLTLIQVKRTLTKSTLVAAVKEAYLITDLCRCETPALLDRLRFQIACREKATPLNIANLSMSDVIETDSDPLSWQSMLNLFDPTNPIIEEPDALDQLHVYLWNVGIQNTTAFIERCLGRMLASFDVRGPDASRSLGRDLASLFFSAERCPNWASVGDVLTPDDIVPDAQVSKYTGVLTGQMPKLKHLRKGYFRDRPRIFQLLWAKFTHWLQTLEASESLVTDKTHVFWVSGRSGEGKSVLLLQLIAEFLRSGNYAPLLHLKSRGYFPRLLEMAPDYGTLSGYTFNRIFAVVDDVYDIRDRDGWDDDVRNACSLRTPPVALITCGPTEQLEQFASRLSDQFEVFSFQVPKLDMDECRAFLAWFEARTGQSRDMSMFTTENCLLVQFTFELAQSVKIPEFARRFKQRLLHLNLFSAVRTILAVNALYMDAPLSLLSTDESRDALERLCENDQLHFFIREADAESEMAGVRLAHPHLSWLLFVEWVEPPTTLTKAWARELAKVLRIMESESKGLTASNLLYLLLNTTHLSDADEPTPDPYSASRRELIRELYRLHVSHHGGRPTTQTLSRWLELEYKIPGLQLVPDPVEWAVAELSDDSRASLLHGSVAGWVWLISESRLKQEAERLQNAAKRFFNCFSNNKGVGPALIGIYNQSQNIQIAKQFITDWLVKNHIHPQVYGLLATQMASNPADAAIIRQFIINWLENNPNHPQAFFVLTPMVAASPGDAAVIRQATKWLGDNPTHPRGCHVITAFLRANRGNPQSIKQANDWFANNPNHPEVYNVLATMVAANPENASVIERAIQWLKDNPDHPLGFQIITALLKANPADAQFTKLSVDWLTDNPNNPKQYFVLVTLVATNPKDDDVVEQVIQWFESNSTHSQAYHLLAALVKAQPANPEVRRLVSDWFANNPNNSHAHHVLAPLVTTNPGDASVIKQATEWLDDNPDHQQYNVLAPLVTANPENAAVVERVIQWLKDNPDHPQAFFVLDSLIKTNLANPEVTKQANDWFAKNPKHPQECVVLKTLVAARPGNAAVMRRAIQWLENNPNHPQANTLIVPLLNTNPGNSEVKRQAILWLTNNPAHRGGGYLLPILVAVNPGDEKVKELAIRWLNKHPTHQQVPRVMTSLVNANPTDAALMKFATDWIKKPDCRHPERTLADLLHVGKAAPKFVEFVLDFMDGLETRDYFFVRGSLSHALVHNWGNAVQYLTGPYDEQRKNSVCTSIVFGMKRYPETIAGFVTNVVDQVTPYHLYYILKNVVTCQVESSNLDVLIRLWLIDNIGKLGYRGMLDALRRNYNRWIRLQKLVHLPQTIIDHFEAWSREG